jgi:phage terminase large subunit-like protein
LPLAWRERAARAIRVFKRFKLPDVIGTPTFGDACGEWFIDILTALFGSYDPAIGRRLVQEAFLLLPKKNSKSTNGAGLILTAALITHRPAAEFVLIAPTKEIAEISFGQIQGMIKLNPRLDSMFHCQPHYRRISDRRPERGGVTIESRRPTPKR